MAESKPEQQKPQTIKSDSNVVLVELIRGLLERADTFIKHAEVESNRVNQVYYSLLIFLAAIVAILAILTYYGKVSGDALLFLVGTIVGYILAFMLEMAKKKWFG